MATKKSTPKKPTTRKSSPEKSASKKVDTRAVSTDMSTPAPKPSFNFLTSVTIIILIGISLFYLAQRYRGLVIAGLVNKSPITRWQLNDVLTRRYGQAVLEELVNNELLTQEAAKQGITITNDDLAAERKTLVESLGGEENLTSALLQYGLSEEDLADQLRLRLLQDRLAEKLFDITVTDEQIKEYFDSNKELFTDKKLADVQEEIKASLTQQQQQQQFYAWFEQIKQGAQIANYLD